MRNVIVSSKTRQMMCPSCTVPCRAYRRPTINTSLKHATCSSWNHIQMSVIPAMQLCINSTMHHTTSKYVQPMEATNEKSLNKQVFPISFSIFNATPFTRSKIQIWWIKRIRKKNVTANKNYDKLNSNLFIVVCLCAYQFACRTHTHIRSRDSRIQVNNLS